MPQAAEQVFAGPHSPFICLMRFPCIARQARDAEVLATRRVLVTRSGSGQLPQLVSIPGSAHRLGDKDTRDSSGKRRASARDRDEDARCADCCAGVAQCECRHGKAARLTRLSSSLSLVCLYHLRTPSHKKLRARCCSDRIRGNVLQPSEVGRIFEMVLECTCASQGISRTLSTVPSASSASKDDIKKGRPHVAFVPARLSAVRGVT